MAVLNAWQRPDYVLTGNIWGDKKDGNATISSCPNTFSAGTASVDQKNATCALANLANGDLFIAIQMQGTGAGQWQFNLVVSGGGTTSITCKKDFKYAFVTGAQFIKVPRYKTATITSHTVPAWNGTIYGAEFILAQTINLNGALSASGIGFRATDTSAGGDNGIQGEGYAGVGGGISTAANGNGGGGGSRTSKDSSWGGAGGGGGGNASAGNAGTLGTGSGTVGAAGAAVGSADLASMFMGGAGGSHGARNTGYGCAASGAGGGILCLFGKSIILSASVVSNGGVGQTTGGTPGASGGGAGGSILLVCDTATLGTYLAATGGSGGTGGQYNGYYGGNGGAGSVGRIAVHHKGTVTGTTSPAYTDVVDPTLKEKSKGGAFLFEFV